MSFEKNERMLVGQNSFSTIITVNEVDLWQMFMICEAQYWTLAHKFKLHCGEEISRVFLFLTLFQVVVIYPYDAQINMVGPQKQTCASKVVYGFVRVAIRYPYKFSYIDSLIATLVSITKIFRCLKSQRGFFNWNVWHSSEMLTIGNKCMMECTI